jgi:dephospho-CoA kinase
VERIFGITGGIGMGKSTVADLLSQRGVAIIDTDKIAHLIVEPGQPALAEVVHRFGLSMLRADGSLDRQTLARLVFTDPQARSDLEAILHPRIRAIWTAEVQRWRANFASLQNHPKTKPPTDSSQPAFGAVIIPLLFETDSAPLLDATICVACSAASQLERLSNRGWSAEQIRQRIQAQWPVEKKMARSKYLVWTDTPMPMVAAQLERILARQLPSGL